MIGDVEWANHPLHGPAPRRRDPVPVVIFSERLRTTPWLLHLIPYGYGSIPIMNLGVQRLFPAVGNEPHGNIELMTLPSVRGNNVL